MIYLIPTPIGNLEDITLRALRILKEVDLILVEDTRVSIKLLKHYDITTPYDSFHMHNDISEIKPTFHCVVPYYQTDKEESIWFGCAGGLYKIDTDGKVKNVTINGPWD